MDAENNVLAENIRVLKVFINLGDKPEDIKVFPLMITSITDRRDANFSVYKSIEATGLAFSELGKQGYKLELNSFTIENDNAQLAEKGEKNTFVDATIQYWLDKVFPNIKDADGKIVKWLTPWCYEIHMDYSYYSENRLSTEVYEDAYVSAWEGSKELQPAGIEKARIKQRQIECSNSNKYNITQDIAQTFGVFCRYEYKTDLNGKFVREWTDENGNVWTGKRVIFYNKAIKSENPYVIDYEKNLQTIERKSEGSNIYSKLYVKPIEASNMTNGYVTIADVAANPSYDEFILNFDYLRSISAINDWQFQKVKEYECNIRRINEKLALVAPVLEKTQAEMNDWEAKVSLNEKQVANAEENRVRYNELYNNTEKEAYRTKTNPRRASVGYDQFKNYYFEFTSYEDVSLASIEAYLNYPTDTPKEYKDGVTIAESQADANFKVNAAQKINYGPEPTSALNLPDDDSQFYAVVDEDSFLRKLYFKMTPKRQAAFVREFGDFNTENHIPWQMYLTFKYHPANKYAARVDQYEALRQSLEDETSGIKASYNKKKQEYETYVLEQQELLSKKEELNLQIENTLGPALREGYWNPSEYKGALRGHNESVELFFDDIPKEGEEELTKVYIGVDQKEAYRNYLVVDDKYNKDFREGDFSSLSITLTSKIDGKTPLTLFNGPDAGFDVILTRLNKEDPVRRTIVFNKDLSNYLPNVSGSSSVSAKYSFSFNDKTEGQDIVLTVDTFEKAKRTQVWPRITINEKNVQYNADSLVIGKKDAAKEEDIPLRKFYDYYYHIENGYPTYTFKITENNPFINFDNLTYNVSYETSTANEMLYLDARQVAKDNSIPRYSYSLTLSNLPHDFKHIDLSQLVYINDYSLGVHAATGYVNEITYHLDEPWEDEINVQNYKTKFEDLFNTIVAQSEAMKNGQPAISNVVNNFSADGAIKGSVIQAALANNDFYFDYSATGVEITPTDGIILTNNKPYANGVYGQVVLQGGGIFISNSIDSNGNRIWSTGITPDGINTNLLTAGQINTDLIKIYSGDDIAFSWSKDGIYAYCDNGNGYDETKYVRFSREGLQATHNNVDRVSLTWDGLFMRNDNGERTFELDTDGNILMSGTLQSFDYRPGILGTGWCIDRTGTAEFNNVKVRGIISASVFNYEETTAVGGQIWVAPTLILTGAQTDKAAFGISTTSGKMTINLRGESCFPVDKPTDAAGREWNFKDLINFNGKIVKINDASEVYEIKNLRVTISNSTYKQQNIASRISSGSLFLDSEFVFDDDLNGIVDWIPDNLLYTTDGVLASKEKHEYFFKHLSEYKGLGDWHLIYNGSADAGTEGVLITAMAAKGPYIDVYDDTPVKNRFKELLGANATEGMAIPPAVRLGKLDGLKDNPLLKEYFGEDNTPRGYGLYSDNVYLTGTIFANAGKFTGTIEANAGNFGGLKIEGNGITSTSNLTISSNSTLQVKSGSGISIESGGRFVLNSDNFKIDENGKVTVKGHVEAESGKIGSLSIEAVEDTSSTVDAITDKANGKVIINKGAITADSLSAGLITTEHIESDFGKKLDISSNEGIGLYVSENGVSTSSVTLDKNGITMKSKGRIEIASGTSLNISSGGSFTIDSPKFKINSSGDVTIEGAVTATSGKIGGWNIDGQILESGTGNSYVRLNGDPAATYTMWAGSETVTNAKFIVQRDGSIKATSGTIGGWSIGSNSLYAGSGTSYVALSTSGTYRIWAGNETASNAPFRVTTDGKVYMTKLMALKDENDTEAKAIDMSTVSLWKLSHALNTVTATNNSDGTVTMTFTKWGGSPINVNFKRAASGELDFSGSGTSISVKIKDGNTTLKSDTLTLQLNPNTTSWEQHSSDSTAEVLVASTGKRYGALSLSPVYQAGQKSVTLIKESWDSGTVYFTTNTGLKNGVSLSQRAHTVEGNDYYIPIEDAASATPTGFKAKATSVYNAGRDSVTINTPSWSSGTGTITATNGDKEFIYLGVTQGRWESNKCTITVTDQRGTTGKTHEVDATSIYDAGYTAGQKRTVDLTKDWDGQGGCVISTTSANITLTGATQIQLTGSVDTAANTSGKWYVHAKDGNTTVLSTDATSIYNAGVTVGKAENKTVSLDLSTWAGGTGTIKTSTSGITLAGTTSVALTTDVTDYFPDGKYYTVRVYVNGTQRAMQQVVATDAYNAGKTYATPTKITYVTFNSTGKSVTVKASNSDGNVTKQETVGAAPLYDAGYEAGWKAAAAKVAISCSGYTATITVPSTTTKDSTSTRTVVRTGHSYSSSSIGSVYQPGNTPTKAFTYVDNYKASSHSDGYLYEKT